MPTLPSMEPVRGGRTPRIPSRCAKRAAVRLGTVRAAGPTGGAGSQQSLASVLECNEGSIRRGRRAGVLLATRHVIFSQPARTTRIPEEG